MTRITWLVDELLSERQYECGFPTLAEAAQELGHLVYKAMYVPHSDWLKDDFPIYGTCVVTHGTIQFCNQVVRKYGKHCVPGLYFNANVKSFEKFAAHIGKLLLNDDFYMLPLAEVKRRNLKDIFIKPMSGMKEFVGQVVVSTAELDSLSKWNNIDPETMCVVASPKDIQAEFRYVICKGKVVTGSEYRWNDILDVRTDTHPLCDALARLVAEAEWQADEVYVCDVALLEEESSGYQYAKVIELNAFSCSGLYACDTYKIVEAVSKAARSEYTGDNI